MNFFQDTEFSKSVNTDGYLFFEGNQVFVLWKWEWLAEADMFSKAKSDGSEVDDVATDDNDTKVDDDDEEIPAITHSVTYKCIGSTKELCYQEVQALAKQKIKKGRQWKLSFKKSKIILLMLMPLHSCALQIANRSG